nr:prokineticin-1 [Columba livia]
MGWFLQTLLLLLLVTPGPGAVITGVSADPPPTRDIYLFLLLCFVPFFGKRQHHTCPCLPNFICSRFLDGRYRCSLDFKNIDF